MAKVLSMGPGDIIIKQGDSSNKVFYLQKGSLNVFIKGDHENKKVGTIEAGELVGEMAFVNQSVRTASVIAATNCELVEVSPESFQAALESLPQWLHAFIKSLMRRINSQNQS